MTPVVAIVADDLTGAADTGIGFRRCGLRTMVSWSTSALSGPADVVAIDLATRGRSAAAAAKVTATAVAAARSAGVATLYKKVDSLLRGHLAAEVAAALEAWGPSSFAVVAPAFPAAGRTTVGGWQLAHGERVGSMPDVLASAGVSAHLGIDPAAARAAGFRAIVCDASTNSDLREIARAGADLGPDVIWVGSGGLASALPAALGLATDHAPPVLGAGRPVLVVVGSQAPRSNEQLARLIGAGCRHVPPAQAGAVLRAGGNVVVTISAPDGPENAALVSQLGNDLTAFAPFVGGLVATGGETATAVLRAFGVEALELVDEVEPGLPLSLARGAWEGPVVTKAGAFGDAGSLVRAVERLEGVR